VLLLELEKRRGRRFYFAPPSFSNRAR